jgi:hydroxymethylpyrimidine pyrophosphatase-like HAD family hydrolase
MTARAPLVVTDLDRTFTDRRLRLVDSAIRAIRDARRQGIPSVLATGRTLPELRRKARILNLFDYVVAEGGGLVGTPNRMRPLSGDARAVQALHLWLNEEAILHALGVVSLSIARTDLPTAAAFPDIRRFQLTPNRNRVDITLRGVDKGAAIQHLRGLPALRGRKAIGFGDGENDLSLFRAVDVRVAVQNAVPALRKLAHATTRWPGGRGVAGSRRRHVLAPQPVLKTRPSMAAAWTRSSSSKTSRRSSMTGTAKPSRPSIASR